MSCKNIFIGFILVILIFITSCSSTSTHNEKKSSTISNSTTKTTSSISSNTQNDTKPTAIPKTDTDFVLPNISQRPFCAMIDNEGSRPLPQGGLNKAQIIYEIIVEGGATRLMPIFWNSAPEMIGPVRSARDYFIDYAVEYDAIYVHFGGSPAAYKYIKKLKWNDIDGITNRDGGIFWDITKEGSKNWQDTYTSSDKIGSQITKLNYRKTTTKKPVFSYGNQEFDLTNSQQAATVTIRYTKDYSCGFIFDPITKKYLRFRKGKPQMERTTNQQLTAKNIIIENVKNTSVAGDDKGRQELADIGKGDGWFITNGKAIKIKWAKASRQAKTKYTDETGKDIVLNQGQTWIQIVPLSGTVTIE
jgi:hypothetical protein